MEFPETTSMEFMIIYFRLIGAILSNVSMTVNVFQIPAIISITLIVTEPRIIDLKMSIFATMKTVPLTMNVPHKNAKIKHANNSVIKPLDSLSKLRIQTQVSKYLQPTDARMFLVKVLINVNKVFSAIKNYV
jgi:hypothetical protein